MAWLSLKEMLICGLQHIPQLTSQNKRGIHFITQLDSSTEDNLIPLWLMIS